MRKFNVKPRIQEFELTLLEKSIGSEMPTILRELLSNYGGLSIFECYYKSPLNKTEWSLDRFLMFDEIHQNTLDYLKEGWGQKMAFAIDPGGWHFCIDLSEKDYGKIWINRWSNFPENEQFMLIAENLDELLRSLKTEDFST